MYSKIHIYNNNIPINIYLINNKYGFIKTPI